jgi:signal transduction histidine kinase
MRRPRARTFIVFALILAGVVNVHALVLNLRAHARLRDSAFAAVRARVVGIRNTASQRLALGARADRDTVIGRAMADGGWESIDVFDGRRAEGPPAAAAAGPWLSAAEMQSVLGGAVLVGAEPGGRGQRVLAYALLPGSEEPTIVRFTAASPALAEDLRDRQQVFLGHAATILVLFLVGGVVMAPRPAEAEPAPPGALVAYEEAMERLRDHGEQQTERHQAERRQLEEVLRDKEALARAGELTAGIVHEVRNGLGTIVGYARLVENTSREAADSARAIREECETLESVIRRFMDFVKRETLSLAPVDVAAMLGRVVGRESRRPGPTVAMDVAGAGSLVGDEALLERAFENLVRNARDAAGASGRVWVSAVRDRAAAVITVSDDGPGLAPATRAALRPFFTTKAGGLGLGLAIALKVIRLHDGKLVLGERAPRGAAVAVRLPVDGPGAARDVTERSAEGLPRAEEATSPKR